MYQDLHFYVDFDWDKYISDSNNYLYQLYEVVQLAYQHKATVFYSEQQIQEFITNCNNLDEGFSISHGNRLEVLLKNAIKQTNRRYLFEICFSGKNTSLHYINNAAISIICSHSKNALISVSNNNYELLLSISSANDFEKVKFGIVNNTENLLKWIRDNSNERIFNLSKKHGENGLGNWLGESPLLCSEHEAQQLLITAIPDFSKKEKQLFNFDQIHHTFIEFFHEGDNPQNQWHGFHIERVEWESRIPKSIRKYFEQDN
jgi:hypothetical protein